MLGKTVWIVGQVKFGTDYGQVWEFQGVFPDELSAANACKNECYFIGPAIVGWPAPDETMEGWPGAYFPIGT